VGSAIVRELERKGYKNLITFTSKEVDLTYPDDNDRYSFSTTESVFGCERPEYVFLCAANVGGISKAINKPVDLLSDNLLIQTNVINACHEYGVKKLINFGSSCMYPVDGKQPYTEEQIGTGKTDENWSYAVAKLAGIELCRAYHRQYRSNFMSVIPCNLYGINDRFDEYGHVIPSLIRKFHEQDIVRVWGNPETKREFLFSDDLAKFCVQLMEDGDYESLYDGIINVGSGEEVTMLELVETIRGIVNNTACYSFEGKSHKSGVPSKLMDSAIAYFNFGWEAKTTLEDGIRGVYEWYRTTGLA